MYTYVAINCMFKTILQSYNFKTRQLEASKGPQEIISLICKSNLKRLKKKAWRP